MKYILILDGQDKYFSAGSWINSDGTFLQSNTAEEIQNNKESLDLSLGANLKIKVFLESDGSVTPSITTITMDYDFYVSVQVPYECIVYGWVRNLEGDSIENASIRVYSEPFFYNDNFVGIDSKVTTNSDGYFEMSVIETETISKTVSFEMNYVENERYKKRIYKDVVIPKQTSVSLGDIVKE